MLRTCTKTDYATWQDQVDKCNFGDPSQIEKLIDSVYTETVVDGAVTVKHFKGKTNYNWLSQYFGSEYLENGRRWETLMQEYHPPVIANSLAYIFQQFQPCDPRAMDNCDFNACELPSGGFSTAPQLEMFNFAIKTPRFCIADHREKKDFQKWVKVLIDQRFMVEDKIMEMMWLLAMIRLTGHKYTLEFKPDGGGFMVPINNEHPYNGLGMHRYGYKTPVFPGASNWNNVVPLTYEIANSFARYFLQQDESLKSGMSPVGMPIVDIFADPEWYENEILTTENYDKIKTLMPQHLFSGWHGEQGSTEIVGNLRIIPKTSLPRFNESTEGGLIIAQDFKNIPIEVGEKARLDYRGYNNAPFRLAIIASGKLGNIITREPITTFGEGGPPITPIGGMGNWEYFNDYDANCNKNKNKPYYQLYREFGMRQTDPDAGYGIIYRARTLPHLRVNSCGLAPIVRVAPPDVPCCGPDTVNTCNGGIAISESVVDAYSDENCVPPKAIKCIFAQCPNANNYKISLHYEEEHKDYNPLTCKCLDIVTLYLYDVETNALTRMMEATINFVDMDLITRDIFVTLSSPLLPNECVKFVSCGNISANDTAPVITSWRCIEEGKTRFQITCGKLDCDTVSVIFYDENNAVVATVQATVVFSKTDLGVYDMIPVNPIESFPEEGEEACSATITCV